MAERLKTKIIEQEKMVDIVCGPDAYRDLPKLLSVSNKGQAAGMYDLYPHLYACVSVCDIYTHI